MASEENVKTEIARVLWESGQDSVDLPFENLTCSPALDTLYDIADQILELPAIAEALKIKCKGEK